MKHFLIVVITCFLVGCGNEYGIKEGTKVWVEVEGWEGRAPQGILVVVKSKVVVLQDETGKISIPKARIKGIVEYQ